MAEGLLSYKDGNESSGSTAFDLAWLTDGLMGSTGASLQPYQNYTYGNRSLRYVPWKGIGPGGTLNDPVSNAVVYGDVAGGGGGGGDNTPPVTVDTGNGTTPPTTGGTPTPGAPLGPRGESFHLPRFPSTYQAGLPGSWPDLGVQMAAGLAPRDHSVPQFDRWNYNPYAPNPGNGTGPTNPGGGLPGGPFGNGGTIPPPGGAGGLNTPGGYNRPGTGSPGEPVIPGGSGPFSGPRQPGGAGQMGGWMNPGGIPPSTPPVSASPGDGTGYGGRARGGITLPPPNPQPPAPTPTPQPGGLLNMAGGTGSGLLGRPGPTLPTSGGRAVGGLLGEPGSGGSGGAGGMPVIPREKSFEEGRAAPTTVTAQGESWARQAGVPVPGWASQDIPNASEPWQVQYNALPPDLRGAYLNARVNKQSTNAGQMFKQALMGQMGFTGSMATGVLNDLYRQVPGVDGTSIENGQLVAYAGNPGTAGYRTVLATLASPDGGLGTANERNATYVGQLNAGNQANQQLAAQGINPNYAGLLYG